MDLFKKKKQQKGPEDDQQQTDKEQGRPSKMNDMFKKEGPRFTKDLQANVTKFKELFFYPENDALKIRELYVSSINRQATVLFIVGTVNTDLIDEHILKPLLADHKKDVVNKDLVEEVMNNIITISSGTKLSHFKEATKHLLNGGTVVLIEGVNEAIAVDTTGFENRQVSEPTTESVIMGPKAAFVESAAVNRSLIQKQLKDQHLITESIPVGKKAPQDVSILYIESLTDKELVNNVKERIENIDFDVILTLHVLEELIEERPYSLFPSCLTTERPDRACSFLLEGHIMLLMDNSPIALVMPITFWSLFQTAEDQFSRMPIGNFSRAVRLIAIFIALLTPALFLAATTFHPEMIPTDLMLAMGATRERIPFPTLWEILLMEITFEILREAGIRVPSPLGATIGIVGALILGQAAVEANLVSPILVIVVSITGLASFAVPDIGLSAIIRILRFVLLFAANFLGFVGIALSLMMILAYAVSIKSFGVPFFSPFTPHAPSSSDLFFRRIMRNQWLRPYSTEPQQKVRVEAKDDLINE